MAKPKAPDFSKNLLFYGDNMDVLRQWIKDESIDLIYLDPPFNSNRTYNVLFKQKSGEEGGAQITAFDDTWTWGHDDEQVYAELQANAAVRVADAISLMRQLIGPSDMLSYLVMMTQRLVELRRVLKETGSLFLHCDPVASHYLKLMLDATFGTENYRAEIIWKRTTAHSDGAQGRRQLGRVHDVIFQYTKSDTWTWNPIHVDHDPAYVSTKYRHTEPGTGRLYRLDNITGPGGAAKGNPEYEVMGVTRHWRYSRERMQQLIDEGRIIQTKPGTVPQFKRYLDETAGLPLQDVWVDISPINSQAAERLGYPTQKPLSLLSRIISMSSNEDDVVLDPFCGCGTTVDAAQRVDRRWIGMDISYLAVDLIETRLIDTYGPDVGQTFEIVGVPRDAEGALALFQRSPFDFERWAVSLIDGQPNEKQVGDRGVDGVIRFPADHDGKADRIIVSVKGGNLNPAYVRDLSGTISSEGAAMGVLITNQPATPGMIRAAQQAGSYQHPLTGRTYQRVQLRSILELLAGNRPAMPTAYMPYVKADKYVPEHPTLPGF